MFKSKKNLFLIVVLGIAIFTRFYNLNWGSPYFFHPDERNMASAVSSLKFPDLNPHFFAYGQFPLYLAYFSSVILNLFQDLYRFQLKAGMTNVFSVSFSQAIFFLRFYSALSQVLLLLIIYKINKILFPQKNLLNVICLMLIVSTPGLIQAAHFGTTESLLTLFLFITTYLSIKIVNNSAKWFDYLLLILTLGFSLGTKLTGLLFFPIPIFALFLSRFSPFFLTSHFNIQPPASHFQLLFYRLINPIKIITLVLFIIFSSIIISFLVSPYNLWQYKDFRGTLDYESNVALGKVFVFYTRQFLNTPPIIFQLTKIFPYTLGFPLLISGLLGLIFIFIDLIKSLVKKELSLATCYLLLTTFSFLVYFIPNAFMFTKWTRFIAPIFPFFAIFSTYFLLYLCHCERLEGAKQSRRLLRRPPVGELLAMTIIGLTIFPGISFFYQVYAHEDIRLTTSRWIYQNIPANSHILSETGNVIDIPISSPSFPSFPLSPTSFDFYHLDENKELFPQLISELEKSNYIFIPSRRIFANHLRLSKTYPLTAKYYDLLFSGKLGFVKIKEFDRFAKFSIFNFQFSMDDEAAEETWSVFDHPVIRIYKKVAPLSKEDYEKLFD